MVDSATPKPVDAANQPEPHAPMAPDRAVPPNTSAETPVNAAPEPWKVKRVGGDEAIKSEFRDGSYYTGRCSITTPLPVGYPEPTPPGAIDLKKYPSVRRAEFTNSAINPDLGMNMGFWPLFNHIKKRDIEMTSPVEMDYSDMRLPDDEPAPSAESNREWTMSFLYRTSDLGPTGSDGKVRVVDTAPVTVVAAGFKGAYSRAQVQHGMERIDAWLKSQTAWKSAGPARAFFYNGPDVRGGDKWGEVQVPVELR